MGSHDRHRPVVSPGHRQEKAAPPGYTPTTTHLVKEADAQDGLAAVVVLQRCGASDSFRRTATQNGKVVASVTVRQAAPFGGTDPACLYVFFLHRHRERLARAVPYLGD